LRKTITDLLAARKTAGKKTRPKERGLVSEPTGWTIVLLPFGLKIDFSPAPRQWQGKGDVMKKGQIAILEVIDKRGEFGKLGAHFRDKWLKGVGGLLP